AALARRAARLHRSGVADCRGGAGRRARRERPQERRRHRAAGCLPRAAGAADLRRRRPAQRPVVYLRSTRPLLVVGDWPLARRMQVDDWRMELMDGARFDMAAGSTMKDPDVLHEAAVRPASTVLSMLQEAPHGFHLVQHGRYWGVYRSDVSPPADEARCVA